MAEHELFDFGTRDIIEIIFAVIVAWLFYQGLALATGTSMPIVSVVSQSADARAALQRGRSARQHVQHRAQQGVCHGRADQCRSERDRRVASVRSTDRSTNVGLADKQGTATRGRFDPAVPPATVGVGTDGEAVAVRQPKLMLIPSPSGF